MNTNLQSARLIALNYLAKFAKSDNFWQDFESAFGRNYDKKIALDIKSNLASNTLTPPEIVIVDRQILGTANAAYAAENNTIYISKDFLDTNDSQRVAATIIEEIGHSIDAQINPKDSAGDEGQIFSSLVRGEKLTTAELAGLKAENDRAVITVDSQSIPVEQDTFNRNSNDIRNTAKGLINKGNVAAPASSLITTDLTSTTATDLVTTLLGSGGSASGITFTGANVAGGTFSGGLASGIGIDSGIILSTGNISFAQGPNNTSSKTANNGKAGDTDLNTIVNPRVTRDAAVLEFDFIPSSSTVSFSYVFASEEYYEYVNTQYNDVFAFYLNGKNIALIPGTTTPVSINSVNAGNSLVPGVGTNSAFFVPNYGTTFNTQFDGFTTVLSATATGLVPGVAAKIKLAIADTGDSALDSAVFIQAASLGNSTLVTVTATDSAAGEGTTPNLGVFTITRTGSTTNDLTVNYALSGTATTGDYNTIPASVTIPAGQTSTTVTVSPTNDLLVEGNETVILSLTDTSNYDLGAQNSATVIIADNEIQTAAVTLAVAPASVLENGTANLVYTFTRQGATTSPLTVNYSVGGAATFGTDYTQAGADSFSSTTGSITFATGSSTATLTIDPTTDTLAEGNETVALTLAAGTGYTIGTATTVTGTIIDDDTPSISLAVSPASVLENGTPNLVYTFTRTGNNTAALTVNYGVAGTATLNSDYAQTGATTFSSTAGSITFAAGASTATLTVNPTGDTTVEADETIALTLAPNASYAIGTTTAVTGTITNDDTITAPTVTLSVAPATVNEDGTTNLVYIFVRTGTATSALTVNYSVGGTATLSTDYTQTGAASFTAITGTVTFAAGATTAKVTIDPKADTIVEANETVALKLTSGTGYTVGTTATISGTIVDDESKPTISIADTTIIEGINGNPTQSLVTVSLNKASSQAISVNYATINGTAIAGTDYTATTGTLTFAAGQTSLTIAVPIVNNNLNEVDETFKITLTAPTNATIADNQSIVTISDTLFSSVTTILPALVENLTLTGTSAINATGNAGDNVLTGNAANNSYIYDADLAQGFDTIKETSTGGIDTLDLSQTAADVKINLGLTTAQTVNANLKLVIPVIALENFIGGSGNDRITGNILANNLQGGSGDDRIFGAGGDDTIFGQGGNDIINGGAGDDTICGGAGNDVISGGAGNDIFRYNGLLSGAITSTAFFGLDTIEDFTSTQDKIYLSKATFSAITSATGTAIGTNFITVDDDSQVATQTASIVYSLNSGGLFYNQNGAATGFGANGGEFANLLGSPTLIATDIVIAA